MKIELGQKLEERILKEACLEAAKELSYITTCHSENTNVIIQCCKKYKVPNKETLVHFFSVILSKKKEYDYLIIEEHIDPAFYYSLFSPHSLVEDRIEEYANTIKKHLTHNKK